MGKCLAPVGARPEGHVVQYAPFVDEVDNAPDYDVRASRIATDVPVKRWDWESGASVQGRKVARPADYPGRRESRGLCLEPQVRET